MLEAMALPAPETAELFRHVVKGCAESLLADFLTACRETSSTEEASARRYVERAVERGFPADALWTPLLSALEASVTGAPRDALRSRALLVSIAWQLATSGVRGEFETTRPGLEPRRLGAWMLPPHGGLHLSSDGERAHVRLDGVEGGSSRSFGFVPGRVPRLVELGDVETWRSCGEIVRGTLILNGGIERFVGHAHLADLVEACGEEAAHVHDAAIRLMRTYASGYETWVSTAVRAVIPLRAANGAINSGSSREEAGVVHASVDCCAEAYAEMLVHEASHQYFHALARIGPVDDGNDRTLYHSPVKECGRPIRMILLAYHAFANVVLLGRRAVASGYADPSGYFAANERFLCPILDELERSLRCTRALTLNGESLWHPLSKALEKGS